MPKEANISHSHPKGSCSLAGLKQQRFETVDAFASRVKYTFEQTLTALWKEDEDEEEDAETARLKAVKFMAHTCFEDGLLHSKKVADKEEIAADIGRALTAASAAAAAERRERKAAKDGSTTNQKDLNVISKLARDTLMELTVIPGTGQPQQQQLNILVKLANNTLKELTISGGVQQNQTKRSRKLATLQRLSDGSFTVYLANETLRELTSNNNNGGNGRKEIEHHHKDKRFLVAVPTTAPVHMVTIEGAPFGLGPPPTTVPASAPVVVVKGNLLEFDNPVYGMLGNGSLPNKEVTEEEDEIQKVPDTATMTAAQISEYYDTIAEAERERRSKARNRNVKNLNLDIVSSFPSFQTNKIVSGGGQRMYIGDIETPPSHEEDEDDKSMTIPEVEDEEERTPTNVDNKDYEDWLSNLKTNYLRNEQRFFPEYFLQSMLDDQGRLRRQPTRRRKRKSI